VDKAAVAAAASARREAELEARLKRLEDELDKADARSLS